MNAKIEFLEHIKNLPTVIAATIFFYKAGSFFLQESYSKDEYNTFLENLSHIDYDDGWGGQELYGYIWYEDGTWSERGEYDGSEWWEYKKCPPIQHYEKR